MVTSAMLLDVKETYTIYLVRSVTSFNTYTTLALKLNHYFLIEHSDINVIV